MTGFRGVPGGTCIAVRRRMKPLVLAALLAFGCGALDAPAEDGDSDSMQTTASADVQVAGQTARVTAADGLNLRSGPGTDYDIVLLMPFDAEVEVLSASGGWYQVSYTGKTGWCSGTYLSI